MLTLTGLEVGHGLCVVLRGPSSTMVYDCGTHGQPNPRRRPIAHRRLVEATAVGPPIETIVLSHLHWDHYCGLLRPIPNLAERLQLVVPRFPLITPDPNTANEFYARLLAFGPLDEQLGPVEIDLLRRIQEYAPRAMPRPMSEGDHFNGADHRWDVLWPPRQIAMGRQGMRTIERAIEAYDWAAEAAPWLDGRLDAIRDTELYNTMLQEMAISDSDPVALTDASEVPDDLVELNDSSVVWRRLKVAASALSAAANLMSLLIVSDDAAMLTGDARPTATNAALSALNLDHIEWLQTPHHGSSHYASHSVKSLDSRVRFSSAGPPHAHTVGACYDASAGLHHRTDQGGELTAHLEAARLRALVIERS